MTTKEAVHPPVAEDGSHKTIAKWVLETLKPSSVLDWGCNTGALLIELNGQGGIPWHELAGVDVPGMYTEFRGPKKSFWVPGYHPFQQGAFDVVTCLEVGEHLHEEAADCLVDDVAWLADKHILWSAATPGQGGWGHVNEQPHEYWLQKFAARGWSKHQFVGVEIAKVGPLAWWYAKNTYLLSRDQPESGVPTVASD